MKISSFTLTFDLEINGEHLLSKCNHCTKFSNYMYQEMDTIYWAENTQKLGVWPWPLNMQPKISKSSRSIHCTKFGNFQRIKGYWADITWRDQLTYRCKTICPKGVHKNLIPYTDCYYAMLDWNIDVLVKEYKIFKVFDLCYKF